MVGYCVICRDYNRRSVFICHECESRLKLRFNNVSLSLINWSKILEKMKGNDMGDTITYLKSSSDKTGSPGVTHVQLDKQII